jgi:hypothetical protein
VPPAHHPAFTVSATASTSPRLIAEPSEITLLWAFVDNPKVEPTNNAIERALRQLVIHRKTSYGIRTAHGSDVTKDRWETRRPFPLVCSVPWSVCPAQTVVSYLGMVMNQHPGASSRRTRAEVAGVS